MDNTLNIIEIIDGKYNLNAQQLQSALILAEGCDSIALISIVGPKNSGKTFLIKCLLSYMKSENKDEWPQKEDGVIEMDYRLTDEDNDRKPVIKLTQNPYIMKDEERKIAVFLIDTEFVFDLEMSSKQENDILKLLLLTSSTVIYNYKRHLPVPQFTRLENTITALSNIDSSLDSMKNIMFLIRDWSPEDHNNEFIFGLYEGSKYIENFMNHIKLNNKYADLNCCLMSAPNHDQHSEHINLSELCPQFLKDVKTLIGCKLINCDEMQFKRKFNSSEFMNSNQLFKLFKDYVQTLNENTLNTNLIDVNEKPKPEDSLRYETEFSKSTANTESNDTKTMINNKNETLDSRKHEFDYKMINNSKLKRSEEQNKRRAIVLNSNDFDSIDSTRAQTDLKSNLNSSIVLIENNQNLKEGEEREQTDSYKDEDARPVIDLIDLTVETDDHMPVPCYASGSSEENSNDYNDESFTILMSEEEDEPKGHVNEHVMSGQEQQSLDTNKTKNGFDFKAKYNLKSNDETIGKDINKSIETRNFVNKENKVKNGYEERPTESVDPPFREFDGSEIFQKSQRKSSQSEDKLSNTQNSDWTKILSIVGFKNTKVKEKDKNQLNVATNKGTDGNSQVNKTDDQIIRNEEVIGENTITFDKPNDHSLDIMNKENDLYSEEECDPESNDHKDYAKQTVKATHLRQSDSTAIFQNTQQNSTESEDKHLVQSLVSNQNSQFSTSNVDLKNVSDGENDNKVLNDVKTDEMYNKTNEQIAKEKQVNDELIKSSLKSHFDDLSETLLLEYRKNMETKLKDQYLDLDEGLKQTHEDIKLQILIKFKNISHNIKLEEFFQDFKDRYYLVLAESMDEELKGFKIKLKTTLAEARQQYEKVIKKILILYDMDMKLIFDNKSQINFKTKSFTEIHRIYKEKALKLFREETVKFYKGNIEREFNIKLIDGIHNKRDKFSAVIDCYKVYESEEKRMFSQLEYVSEEIITEFYNKQKSQIFESLKNIKDQELILRVLTDVQKSVSLLKENNNQINQKEKAFAINAVELALQLYEKYFDEKLKTSFFNSHEVNEIRDKLFDYTLKLLLKSCHFNEYQNYLIESCEEWFELKVNKSHKKKSTEYQIKVNQTSHLLNQAIKNAFETYIKEMNNKLLVKMYLKSNEFAELHHKCSKKANQLFDDLTMFLKIDFEPNFAKNKLLEYQSVLRQRISTEKDKLKVQNEKNTPTINSMAIYLGRSHMIAATYRYNKVELITDYFKQHFIPNSISFGPEILFGTEAKNHYETSFPDLKSYHNFDIKQLIGRERNRISSEELGAFPFRFLNDKLSVRMDFHDLKFDLSIESLLALMILDIKSKAEKQIGNKMSNIVLTVPTNYTINKKNAIRNAAKMAGLEEFEIISEISAAAVSYATDKSNYYKRFTDIVLFVIVNDYECDAAICGITQQTIQYKAYFHKNLNSTEEEKRFWIQKIWNKTTHSNAESLEKHKFKALIEELFKKAELKRNFKINECVISGDSPLMPGIKDWINKYVKPIPSMISNSMDNIIKGSTIYGEMLSNKIDFIEISEVTTHSIFYSNTSNIKFDIKYIKEDPIKVFSQNTPLPINKRVHFGLPKVTDLPMKITIFEGQQINTTHIIEKLPISQYSYHLWHKHTICFDVDCFGEISIMSLLVSKDHSSALKIDSIVINPGLSDEEICLEKEKLNALLLKIEEKKKFKEENLCLGQAMCELSSYCQKVKNEVENNQELRPLIKKQINLELDKTLTFLSSGKLDLNSVKEQNKMLSKTLKSYMK